MKKYLPVFIVIIGIAILVILLVVSKKKSTDIPVVSLDQTNGAAGEVLLGDSMAATIDSIRVVLQESFPVQGAVEVQGNLMNGCISAGQGQARLSGDTFFVNIPFTHAGHDMACTEALVPFTQSVDLALAGLPAGIYGVDVHGLATSFELTTDNFLDFIEGK